MSTTGVESRTSSLPERRQSVGWWIWGSRLAMLRPPPRRSGSVNRACPGELIMAVKTVPFDPAEYLETEEGQAAYLDEAFATGDLAFIADALGVVARARGMTERSP